MTALQTITAGTGADTRVNENFAQTSPAALYARDPVASTGLTWGYKGGMYSGVAVADGNVSLTASTTNYVVANRSTGAVSTSTGTTNWNDAASYLRLYSVVTGTATVTSWSDYRQIIGMSANTVASVTDFANDVGTTAGLAYGYQAGQLRSDVTLVAVAAGNVALTDNTTNYVEVSTAGAVSKNTTGFTLGRLPLAQVTTSGGAITGIVDKRAPFAVASVTLGAVNVYTKNQSVTPVTASVSGTYTPDASASNSWQLTMTGNTTLANPTNLTSGMVLNFVLDEDGSGGHTIALGNAFKWPGGTVPVWITTANAKNFFSGYYDGTVIRCGGGGGYA